MPADEQSRVTAIEPQKGRAGRVSVFVDGEFAAGLHEDVASSLGLRVGQEISGEALQAAIAAETHRRALDSALRLLGYRARSRAEMRQRLLRKGYDDEIVDEAVRWLEEHRLLDDVQFSQAWVELRSHGQPMGRERLAWELRSKGVDRETVAEALEPRDDDTELSLALQVGRQKLDRTLDRDPAVVRNRVAAALQRRGFSWSVTRRVLAQLLAIDPDEME
jgi:regulatory protein